MCYSARIESNSGSYGREHGARVIYRAYHYLFAARKQGQAIKVPLAVEAGFLTGQSEIEQECAAMIREHRAAEVMRLEQDMFAQRRRLADAERKLASKITKAASESKRIAGDKVEQYKGRLEALQRTEPKGRDARIFPGSYAHVLIVEDGERVLRPMRFGCRPAGKPAINDKRYPGTYNSRRTSLNDYWRGQFGQTHGLALWWRFYEHVQPSGEDIVLEFTPGTGELMTIACLYSKWTPPAGSTEPELWSFSAITDEPPPEVAAAGHDRCIIPLKPEHVDAWLNPRGDLDAMQAIFDDKQRFFFEHRLAA